MRVLVSAIALCLAQPALGQTTPLDILAAKRQAVIEQWEAMPLLTRHVMFVVGRPGGYGAAIERPTHVFAPGEPLITYIEPVGYGWKPAGPLLNFGFDVDFLLKQPDGTILGGKTDFLQVTASSHEKVTEFMVTLTLNLTNVPPGDYILEYHLRDIASAKDVTTSQPVTIAP